MSCLSTSSSRQSVRPLERARQFLYVNEFGSLAQREDGLHPADGREREDEIEVERMEVEETGLYAAEIL